jgi:hypothetical protein
LSANDLEDEQQYLLRMRYRHNRLLHGLGIVTGLAVTVAAETSPPSVVVEPGLALDRTGREIELSAPVVVEITDPDCSRYVIVEYVERDVGPAPSAGGGAEGVASRIEEGASIRLSADDFSTDGIAIARLVRDPAGWRTDRTFEPTRSGNGSIVSASGQP